jgi:hypothetical protein
MILTVRDFPIHGGRCIWVAVTINEKGIKLENDYREPIGCWVESDHKMFLAFDSGTVNCDSSSWWLHELLLPSLMSPYIRALLRE